MKRRRGFIQWAILHLLKEGSMHGYQIMKELESRSGGLYSASAGTVYPALQELLEKELIDLEPESDKKTYFITEKGTVRLKEFTDSREGEFWDGWKARWVWQNSDEATQLKATMDLWEIEMRRAVKQARRNPEGTAKLVAFMEEITERLRHEI
ncbi:PadR family transcriptional regulator [Psychrobacillus sp.]|uniref:PadR family transcriptional regulator n=1 Tax=Psychrobacillus sp. TaxID=1871623 RepID=UPI0028BF0375|nr:PadR family transcriptional regulator [Psychrobacillus sp.]